MKVSWSWDAWEDYEEFWHRGENKSGRTKIAKIIKELKRDPHSTAFMAEKLKYDLSGWSAMRIDQEHRFVYKASKDHIEILSCRFHYE